jgi:cyclopropane fatty-acyl-phospholipid synthase-like methyltransferase
MWGSVAARAAESHQRQRVGLTMSDAQASFIRRPVLDWHEALMR